MARRRIFISHSNSDPDSADYIDAIDEALTGAGFDVLVDRKRLNPGVSWRDEIYTWIGLCHGAVILVSEAARRPDSIWVPRETSILLWRRTLDPKFVVVPAYLGSVKPGDLNMGVFADMQLGEIQAAPAATPTELAVSLTQRFAYTSPKTPLDVLATRLAELLATISHEGIEEASEALAMDLARDLGVWFPTGDLRRGLALGLLQAPLRDSVRALEVLAEFSLESAKADLILSMIAPSWVDLCAARWLADCGTCSVNKPALVLNASTAFSARMYVDRAGCRPPRTRWPIVSSTGVHGESVAREIAAEVEFNLIQEFRLAGDASVAESRARLYALLAERQRDGRPVFVSLSFTPAISTALSELQRSLPDVTFLLLTGVDFPATGVLEGQHVRFVEPRLKPGVELQAQRDFDYARSVIRRQDASF